MVAVVASADNFLLRFDSDIGFVDYALDIIDDLLAYRGIHDRTDLLIVCRELLKNAVVHGNRNDTQKSVTLRLQCLPGGHCKIEAEDGGSGFDVQARAGGQASGRPAGYGTGFALIGALADRVAFNDQGNRVTVFVDL